MSIIGREPEQRLLEKILSSGKPEFLAVYGRRRIGKTFLIREFFKLRKVVFLKITGAKDAPLAEQLAHFMQQVGETFFHGVVPKQGKNWDDTFRILTDSMRVIPAQKKIVLFFDEFPWMATKNSRLLQNLDYYWNQHWSDDSRIKLIICGSSASWILDKIVHNKGGLYNRVTETIHLEPFNLRDTRRFLRHNGINLNNKQVLEIYMTIGGIPHYLSKVNKGLTATENIEQLAFKKKSFLLDEFEILFASLFDNCDSYIDIVNIIAGKRYGIRQEELFKKLGHSLKGYSGLSKLDSLEKSGFIMSFVPHFHKNKGRYYKIVDEYTLFYCRWIKPVKETLLKNGLRKGFWQHTSTSSAWTSWSGYAFESVCYKHLIQIEQALDLSADAIPDTWQYFPAKGAEENGAQIDLLFDRRDDAITVCEIKHSMSPFKIDKSYANKLRQKIDVFLKRTKTSKQIFIAMVLASGLKASIYSEELVDRIVVLDDLFKST